MTKKPPLEKRLKSSPRWPTPSSGSSRGADAALSGGRSWTSRPWWLLDSAACFLPLCVPEMGLLLWPWADLSPFDTPPGVTPGKRDSFALIPHIPHQTRRNEVGGVGRISSQKGFIPAVLLSDSHFYVLLYSIGMMWDHDGKEKCLYTTLIKMFWHKTVLACFWVFLIYLMHIIYSYIAWTEEFPRFLSWNVNPE